ncbi:MAG: hypothetical protein IPH80_06685 [Myxococcales bacterium]|nr:hypothetical protein [Myxococcales bacterium]
MPRTLAALALAALATTACTEQLAPAAQATTPVRFALSLDARAFMPGTTVEVEVWNEAALAARARSGDCMIGHSAAGEEIICPPGVTYQPPPTPERFTFTVDELGHGFAIAALSIGRGEAYEIAIGGRAADGCNHAGATARGVADRDEIALADLDVFSTTMACRTGG